MSFTQLSSSNQGETEKPRPVGRNPRIAIIGHDTQSIISTSLPARETQEKTQRQEVFPVA